MDLIFMCLSITRRVFARRMQPMFFLTSPGSSSSTCRDRWIARFTRKEAHCAPGVYTPYLSYLRYRAGTKADEKTEGKHFGMLSIVHADR